LRYMDESKITHIICYAIPRPIKGLVTHYS
jgi:hypothetical protein